MEDSLDLYFEPGSVFRSDTDHNSFDSIDGGRSTRNLGEEETTTLEEVQSDSYFPRGTIFRSDNTQNEKDKRCVISKIDGQRSTEVWSEKICGKIEDDHLDSYFPRGSTFRSENVYNDEGKPKLTCKIDDKKSTTDRGEEINKTMGDEQIDKYFQRGSTFRSDNVKNSKVKQSATSKTDDRRSTPDSGEEINKKIEDHDYLDSYFPRGSIFRSDSVPQANGKRLVESNGLVSQKRGMSAASNQRHKANTRVKHYPNIVEDSNYSKSSSKQSRVSEMADPETDRKREGKPSSLQQDQDDSTRITQMEDCSFDSYFSENSIFRLSKEKPSYSTRQQPEVPNSHSESDAIKENKACLPQKRNEVKSPKTEYVKERQLRSFSVRNSNELSRPKSEFNERISYITDSSRRTLDALKVRAKGMLCKRNAEDREHVDHCHQSTYKRNPKQTSGSDARRKKSLCRQSSHSADDITEINKKVHTGHKLKQNITGIFRGTSPKSKTEDRQSCFSQVMYRANSEGDCRLSGSSKTWTEKLKASEALHKGDWGNPTSNRRTMIESQIILGNEHFSVMHTFTCDEMDENIDSLANASSNTCWAAFNGASEVFRIDMRGKTREVVTVYGGVDDIASDREENLYISLTNVKVIIVYKNEQVRCLVTFPHLYPRGIAYHPSSSSLVACCNLSRTADETINICSSSKVKLFSTKSKSPQERHVTKKDCFAYPVRVAVNQNDDVIVTDFEKKSILSITPKGSIRFGFRGCAEFPMDEQLPSVVCDQHSNIYIISRNGDVCLLDPYGNLLDIITIPVCSFPIHSALFDKNGNLWLGCDDGHVFIFRCKRRD